MSISIQHFTTGKWKENCYVVHGNHGDAVIIDPGGAAEAISEYVDGEKLNLFAILNTHAHYDHIGAARALQTRYAAPFYLHSQDIQILKMANLYRKVFDGDDPISLPTVDYGLDRQNTPLHLGDLSIELLLTPGHTAGGVCFQIQDCLFTGDTLLKGRIGRADLPGGDSAALGISLRTLSALPDATKLYPGHGKTSNMQDELRDNTEFLQAIQAPQ